MKVFLGADHRGFRLKHDVFAYLSKRGVDVEDIGDKELNPEDDFPQFAAQAALRVLGEEEKEDPRGILLCGGGQGMAMAANRFRGIRASVITTELQARLTRNDNDSNILCLPADMLEDDSALWQTIIDVWIATPFANAERYKRRNRELDELA